MKLDLNCVRDILIALEDTIEVNDTGAQSGYNANILKAHPKTKKYSDAQIMYTLRLMVEAGLVSFQFEYRKPDFYFRTDAASGITFAGHQYLASIRDDNIWSKTMDKLKKVGNTATLSLVTAISEGIAKAIMDISGI